MSKLEIVRMRAKEQGIQGDIHISDNPKKKFYIVRPGSYHRIYFGATGYDDFLDHKNPVRRENYLKRAKGIRKADGSLAWLDPDSPNFYAVRLLW